MRPTEIAHNERSHRQVGQLVPALMERLKRTLQVDGLSGEDREKQTAIQGLLCGALQVIIGVSSLLSRSIRKTPDNSTKVIIQKLDDSIVLPQADQLMMLFLRVLGSKTATVQVCVLV